MARLKLLWSQPALDDLDEIAAFIAEDKPAAAGTLVEQCLSAVERLVDFPESGRRVPESPQSHRELIVPPCRIIYRHDGRRVYIVYVVRGERRLRRARLQ